MRPSQCEEKKHRPSVPPEVSSFAQSLAQFFVEIDDFAIVLWPLNPLKHIKTNINLVINMVSWEIPERNGGLKREHHQYGQSPGGEVAKITIRNHPKLIDTSSFLMVIYHYFKVGVTILFIFWGEKKCGHRPTADQVVVIVERKGPCWIPSLERHLNVHQNLSP